MSLMVISYVASSLDLREIRVTMYTATAGFRVAIFPVPRRVFSFRFAPTGLDGSQLAHDLLCRVLVRNRRVLNLQDGLPGDLDHVPGTPVHGPGHQHVGHRVWCVYSARREDKKVTLSKVDDEWQIIWRVLVRQCPLGEFFRGEMRPCQPEFLPLVAKDGRHHAVSMHMGHGKGPGLRTELECGGGDQVASVDLGVFAGGVDLVDRINDLHILILGEEPRCQVGFEVLRSNFSSF
jgi:hypothetical protein